MRGAEFLKKLQRLAQARDLNFRFDPAHGKGSHGRVWLGGSFTILKDRKKELGPGLLRQMCRDLGVDPRDL